MISAQARKQSHSTEVSDATEADAVEASSAHAAAEAFRELANCPAGGVVTLWRPHAAPSTSGSPPLGRDSASPRGADEKAPEGPPEPACSRVANISLSSGFRALFDKQARDVARAMSHDGMLDGR